MWWLWSVLCDVLHDRPEDEFNMMDLFVILAQWVYTWVLQDGFLHESCTLGLYKSPSRWVCTWVLHDESVQELCSVGLYMKSVQWVCSWFLHDGAVDEPCIMSLYMSPAQWIYWWVLHNGSVHEPCTMGLYVVASDFVEKFPWWISPLLEIGNQRSKSQFVSNKIDGLRWIFAIFNDDLCS